MANMKLFLVILFLSVPVETQSLREQKVYEEVAQTFMDQHPIWFQLSWIKSSLLSLSEDRIADIREKKQKVAIDHPFSDLEYTLKFPKDCPVERVCEEISALEKEILPKYIQYMSSHITNNIVRARWDASFIVNDAERQCVEALLSEENNERMLIEEELAFHKAFVKLLKQPCIEEQLPTKGDFSFKKLFFWR